MLLIPAAMDAELDSLHFWGSLVAALAVAGSRLSGEPVDDSSGLGHVKVHAYHHQ
jgi:hypothetical protein